MYSSDEGRGAWGWRDMAEQGKQWGDKNCENIYITEREIIFCYIIYGVFLSGMDAASARFSVVFFFISERFNLYF